MSKGLEALNSLFETMPFAFLENNTMKELKIIEKELKEYEEMKRIKGTTTLDNALEETLIKSCPNVAKKLKALEIIKNIGILKPYETSGNQCWLETMCDATKITKDNYDLLKEVLS